MTFLFCGEVEELAGVRQKGEADEERSEWREATC